MSSNPNESGVPKKMKGRGRARIRRQMSDVDSSSSLSLDTDASGQSGASDCSFSALMTGSSGSQSSLDQDTAGGRGVNRTWSRGSSVEAVGRKKFGRGRGLKPREADISVSSSDLSDDGLAISDLQIQDHALEEPNDILLPPQQRIKNLFPGLSNKGRPCKVETNHYSLSIKIPEGIIYMYEVTIQAPWVRKYRQSDKKLYHAAIAKWKELCPAVQAEKNCWVFDGYQQLYSTKKHQDAEFEKMKLSVYWDEEERNVDMIVKDIARVMDINVTKAIVDWSNKGRSGSMPQDCLEALNVVLKHATTTDLGWTAIGRSFFPPRGKTLDLGFGKEVWTGLFSTVRPNGWKDHNVLLTLNVDTSNKPAVQPLHLTDNNGYVYQVLSGGRRDVKVNLDYGLNDFQRKLLSKDLEQFKVKYEVPFGEGGVRKRQYKVIEVRKRPANQEMIHVDGEPVSVVDYFYNQYGIKLRYPNLPCLWVGSRDKTTYIPMEFCTMMSQPMPRKKKLQDDAVANMIRQTAIKPLERQQKIKDGLMANNQMYKNDPYAKEFGISLAGTMTKLTGRILDPPSIEYKTTPKMNGQVKINPQNPGKWFMDKKQFVSGVTVNNWAFLNMAHPALTDEHCKEIQNKFYNVGKENGLSFNKGQSVLTVKSSMRDQEDGLMKVEGFLEKINSRFEKSGKSLDLVIIVFPFKAGLIYDRIKHVAEMKLGITTQCCLRQSLYKKGELSAQVIANICLKINSKLGGVNHVLSNCSRPSMLKRPVMIMGADVSHPAPEARGIKPSIAAIVASMDPKAVNYEVQVRIQDMGLVSTEEVIQDMKNVTKKLLMKFFESNGGRKPEKIVIFRDGCSEGQFLTVLAQELLAMRQACKELEEGYQPPITFIVVQKRHHTRFFPTDNNKYKNGNALAGTVIDQGINHPTEGDFYLVSHEGIQGTSRPCHYHVLWDDSNFHADDLETLAYYLCHLYSRCTRSVSYPTPTYYAHLVADRARKHHNELAGYECGGSTSGNSAGSVRLTEAEKRKIQEVLERGVAKPMYFV